MQAEELSDCETMDYGVPQSSLLGPTFSIYINDLNSLNYNAEIFWFAHDIAIFFEDICYKFNINNETNFRFIKEAVYSKH